jgi:Abnormal spindle-like microcephaly-assoc'd, ASPM-SPD-2-Hydin
MLSNTGSTAVTVSQATISTKNFSLLGMAFPVTVTAGQSVPVQIQFAPQQAGNLSATLSVTSNATDGTMSVALAGTGTQPALSVSPSPLTFGSVSVGGNATDNVTLTNAGNLALTITAANLSGPAFSMSGLSMPLTLASNQSSSFSVQFAPTAGGSASGSVSFVSNAPGSPTTLTLSGTGESSGAALNASPSSIAFGSVVIGSHPSRTVTLKNTGTSSISISQMAVSGSVFAVSGISVPLTLPGGQATSFAVTFTPAASGADNGNVTVTSTASNPSLIISLSGTGATAQPQLTISPASVGFGSVAVGTTTLRSVNLSNTGTAALTVSAASASGTGFSVSGLALPTTLSPGQNATFNATFTPAAAGSASGTLSVTSNVPGSPTPIPLNGTGAQGQLSATPATVAFGNVSVGGNILQAITLTNTGSVALTISKASVTGTGFTLSGLNMPTTINAGASSTFTVTFAPTATGNASGSVSLASNALNPTLVISLTGAGIQPQLSATPSSVSFGNVPAGSNASQMIALTNSGTASVTITQATVSPSTFSMSGLTVPLTINPGKSSTFTVAFAPISTGSVSGSATLTSNATSSPMTISLAGSGVSATLQLTANPTSLDFGNVQVGSTGTQTATLTNTGSSSVTISQMTASGPGYNASGVGPGQVLSAGQSVPITVTFTPATTGSATGTVTITSNASNSPAVITLTGASHLVNLSWTASTTSTVVGYNVYRGTISGGPYAVKLNSTVVPATAYTDTAVQAGQTYFYVVTAVDSSGAESVYSNQASALVPTP